jgi:hypothetical protein
MILSSPPWMVRLYEIFPAKVERLNIGEALSKNYSPLPHTSELSAAARHEGIKIDVALADASFNQQWHCCLNHAGRAAKIGIAILEDR